MKQYQDLLNKIMFTGNEKTDRTGTGTRSIFGYQMRFNLEEGFPLVTTKKVHTKSIIHELLWFISGDTNIKYLVDNGVKIWNDWPYERYKKHPNYEGETMDEYVQKIKDDENNFALKYGGLGPVYGKQWRDFNGIDQLKEVIEQIKENPNSRRLIVNAWNPSQLEDMALPPCHMMFQFYVEGDRLSLQMYQRSADAFLGVPFNIASYSLLLMMVAQVTGLKAGDFIHTIGDAHIYKNHIDQVYKQLERTPFNLPKMSLNEDVTEIDGFRYADFRLEDYKHHPAIKGDISI